MTDDVAEGELAELPIVLLDLPSARDLAGHSAVHRDLVFVTQCCSLLTQLMDHSGGEPNPLVAEALWSAAVIAYARCFKDGKRKYRPQPADIEALGLEGEVLDFHNLILALRDKHVAHSVNPFEQLAVGAVLSPADAPDRRVEAISVLGMRLAAHECDGVWQLGNLACHMADAIGASIQQQTSAVLAEAQALDVDALYALPPLRAYAPASEAATKARSRSSGVAN